jgi:beta-glucanase (GH16 family)
MKYYFLLAVFFLLNSFHTVSSATPAESYSTTLFDDFDSSQINNSRWQVATWSEHGGQTGKDRCYVKDGFLNMVFVNSSNDGFMSAAIQTREEFLFGRWEARLKPSSVPGVLNSFYTIDWDNTADNSSASDGTKQEIDIEFLTFAFSKDSGSVHYAVHEQNRKSIETNPDVPLSFNPSDDFHVYGFDITPEKIEWFVDSKILKTYAYADSYATITAPYQLKLNVWSSKNWINGPPQADVETVYLIDWIRFTPYTSASVLHTQKSGVDNKTKIVTGSNNVEIFVNDNSSCKPLRCVLYTIDGSCVYPDKKLTSDGRSVFTFSNKKLTSGWYIYNILSGDKRISGTLIVNGE